MFDENDKSHMGHIILEYLKKRPENICQIDAATGKEETNGSVLRRSVLTARALRRLGFNTGDVMVLSGNKHLDLHIPYYAALMNGYPISAMDPIFKLDETRDLFKIIEPKLAFCDPHQYDNVVTAVRDLKLDTRIFTFGTGKDSLQELLKDKSVDDSLEDFEPATFDMDTVYAWLASTGGTTGVMKVAAITHTAWKEKMNSLMRIYKSKAPEQLDGLNVPGLNLASIQWISGLFQAISMPVLRQTMVQTSAPLTGEHVIDIINKYKPVSGMFHPALATSVLKVDKPCDFSCFSSIVLSGSKVYKDLLVEFKKRLSERAVVYEAYGQTENLGPVFGANPFGPSGNCGRCLPGMTIKLVDPDTCDEITEANVPGELWTKGSCFSEYYNNPEATAQAFSEDGWFKTGDMMYRDEDDNFFFIERLKMLIKYRNNQIVPPEIETVIRSLEGVLDVSVTSIPDEEDGEHPVACVVRRPGSHVTAQQIKDLVASKLSDSKQLRGGVVFMQELPYTHVGKVARGKLRQIVTTLHRE